jgi:ACT domain-containing protein
MVKQKDMILSKKSLAQAVKIVDMTRSLCEKYSPFPLSVFVASRFIRIQPRR